MKTIALIILTTFFSKSCSTQQQADLKNTVLEYTANTRGFYMNIIIKDQTITVSRDRNNKQKVTAEKIEDADWKALIAEFEKINLEKLADYNDPTQKRFYDGAAIANLHIVYKDKTYDSKEFDHGIPPVEIEKLVKLVVSLSSPK